MFTIDDIPKILDVIKLSEIPYSGFFFKEGLFSLNVDVGWRNIGRTFGTFDGLSCCIKEIKEQLIEAANEALNEYENLKLNTLIEIQQTEDILINLKNSVKSHDEKIELFKKYREIK